MSSSGVKREERYGRGGGGDGGGGGGGGGSWRDSDSRHPDRRFSPPHSASRVTGDDNVKREDKLKRERSSKHADDEHNSTSHYKRPKTEATSAHPAAHSRTDSSRSSPLPSPPPPPVVKESINLGLSGKLAAHANTTIGGSILKYQPPADAAQPTLSYRLYCFPTTPASASASASAPARPPSPHPPLYIHSQPLYRIGRDPLINDLPIPHPSVSKQHAVLQYRRPATATAVRLYVLDVGSVNGTTLNGQRLDEARYVEVRERDVLCFGQCGVEYVLMHGESRAGGGSGSSGEEKKEGRGGGKKEECGGGKKRPAWADDEDDDV